MGNVKLHINRSLTDQPLDYSGVEWVEIDPVYDSLIFSNGGAGVADGEDTPTEEELNRAAVQLSVVAQVIVPKYFLLDYSADMLKEIMNAGNKQTRYVFCCEFDNATATEPQLELWDNSSFNTYANPCLGLGNPVNSWYKGICTTNDTPLADWTGISLGGNNISHVLLLNDGDGALTIAKNLYFNFKIVIPGGYIVPSTHTPVFLITYTTN